MKKNMLLLFLFLGNYAFCQEAGIDFKTGNWKDVQGLAKLNNKPLFIFAYSPNCHFCKKMEATVFSDKKVSSYYKATFINYKLNLEEGEGLDLAKRYNINAFPTYVYFDKDGNLLHISGAAKPADDFIQDGKNAFDPNKAYTALKTRYGNGERSPGLLYNLTTALSYSNISDEKIKEVATAYLHTQSEKDMISKKNMDFIFNQSLSFDAPATSYFFKNYNLLSQSYGAKEITARSRSIIGGAATQAGLKSDSTQLSNIIEFLKVASIKEKEEYIALAALKYKQGISAREKDKWVSYADAALSYVKKFGSHDHFTGYEAASYLYYYTDDKESLQKATRLIEQEIAADASYDNILLRAKLFRKMGDENKATSYAKRAIDIAGEKKEDDSDAKDLLKEIKESIKK